MPTDKRGVNGRLKGAVAQKRREPVHVRFPYDRRDTMAIRGPGRIGESNALIGLSRVSPLDTPNQLLFPRRDQRQRSRVFVQRIFFTIFYMRKKLICVISQEKASFSIAGTFCPHPCSYERSKNI